MHLHILGICGTFMGGLAAIARQAGHTVTGCDDNVYPPMSEQLAALGIELTEGYEPEQIQAKPICNRLQKRTTSPVGMDTDALVGNESRNNQSLQIQHRKNRNGG